MTKPVTLPAWECTNPGAEVTDPLTKTLEGWHTDEAPAAGHINYVLKHLANWIDWVNTYGPGLELNNTFVGDNALEGTLTLSPPGAEEDPSIIFDTGSAVSDYQAIMEINPNSTDTDKSFLYVNADGDVVISRNCYWDTDTSEWFPTTSDTGYSFSKYVLKKNGLFISAFSRTAETSWPDSSWVYTQYGPEAYLKSVTDSTLANLPTTYGPVLTVSPKQVAKCWGHVTISGAGAFNVVDGVNIASGSCSFKDSNTSLEIVFAAGLRDTNYTIVGNFYATGSGDIEMLFNVHDKATSAFRISAHRLSTSALVDLTTSAGQGSFSFVVFGEQDA